jgi:molybdopterin-binding aldehyde dehydrogenase-like protein
MEDNSQSSPSNPTHPVAVAITLRINRQGTPASRCGTNSEPTRGPEPNRGRVVMGIGMALFEHTTYDPQNGAPITSNLADYVVAVNADVPSIDVHFLDYPDKEIKRTLTNLMSNCRLYSVVRLEVRFQ